MMRWFVALVHQGGPTMLWIAYLLVAGLIITGLHLYTPRRWSTWCSAAVIALVLGVGIFGTLKGRSMTDHEAAEFRAEGYAEANRPIQFATVVAGGLAAVFGIGELRRRALTRAATRGRAL